jgi:signal transduction histidine kinase
MNYALAALEFAMDDDHGKATLPPTDSAALAAFAAHCAHDFNNLLTGILGNLELMQNRARRDKVTAFDGYLDGARHAAGRAADFSQRLLALSGRTAGDPVAVPVNQLARDIVDLLREQGVDVVAELHSQVGMAFCDPAQLELALQELLTNARDAISEGGVMSLTTHPLPGAIRITVSNTGTVMTPAVLARACEPFFTTRPGGAGKGLGLPIVAHFVQQVGGSMTINSVDGKFTRVALVLPSSKTGN